MNFGLRNVFARLPLCPSCLARGMASRVNLKTLYDYMAPGMTNLMIGTPGDSILRKCAEAVKKAAAHRMVHIAWHDMAEIGSPCIVRQFCSDVSDVCSYLHAAKIFWEQLF